MRKRIPWLLALLALGLIVSTVIGSFQSLITIPQLFILFSFQSLILDMGGNTGTQSLGVTIRVISDDELDKKNRFKFIFKELRVGFFNGLLIGTLAFIAVGIFLTFISPVKDASKYFGFEISACIGIALLCSMVVASLDGTLIPILFKKIGIDPAVASGPLITTVNDLVAVCIYYGVSLLLFVEIGLFTI